jgi:hypothetical protein
LGNQLPIYLEGHDDRDRKSIALNDQVLLLNCHTAQDFAHLPLQRAGRD